MARPIKEVEQPKKKPVMVEEVKTLEKPAPKPSPAPRKPLSPAPLANPFDLLDEESSDLITIVDAKEEDAFVAAERKRIEEEKEEDAFVAAERRRIEEAKIKAKKEENKAAKEAQKRAEQEKKGHEASLLRFRSSRPTPSFSRPSASANDGELAKNLSGLELQAKEGQAGGVEEKAVSVDGSSISSEGRRRRNVNGSLRRKLKKNKKAEGEKKEGEDQQEKQGNQNAAPVGFKNYPNSYTMKEYEEGKHKVANPTDQSQQRFDNGEPKRFDNGGPRRFDNEGPRRFDKGGQGPRRFNNEGKRRFDNGGQRQQAPVEKAAVVEAVVKPDVSFSLKPAEFPVLGTQVPVVKAPKAVVGKAVAKAPKVVGKAVAKKA